MHNKSTYPVQGTIPTTAAGQIAVYSKAGGSGTDLYMVRDNNAATETKLTTSKITAPVAGTNGITFLPGGIIMQWGQLIKAWAAGGDIAKITFTPPFPNAVYNVQVTIGVTSPPSNKSASLAYYDLTLSSVFVNYADSSGTSSYGNAFWVAIGS